MLDLAALNVQKTTLKSTRRVLGGHKKFKTKLSLKVEM